MRKILFILLISISSLCHASNLEFSQVILIDGSVAFSRTVPTGKVWKIESATRSQNCGCSEIKINSKEAIITSYGSDSDESTLPIWLPEGTTITDFPTGSGTYPTNSAWISIIEYNIVP